MDLSFSETERQLRDTLRRYLERHNTLAQRTATSRTEPGWRPDLWAGLASRMGVLGLLVPAAQGGVDGTATDLLIVMEEIGRTLLVEPYLETAVVAADLLRAFAPAGDDLLRGIAAGEIRFAVSLDDACALLATREDDGWRLSGDLAGVVAAPWATHLLIAARCDDGEALFVVDPAAPGVSVIDYPTIDGRRAADIAMSKVGLARKARLSSGAGAATPLARARDLRDAALGAEAVGIMHRMLEDTRDHCLGRSQFGQPIARFQVLQHRLVDMYVMLEMATSAVLRAILSIDAPAATRRQAVRAATVTVSDALRFVAQNAVQLHGGMGMSDDTPVSHYFRRATAIGLELGAIPQALATFAELAPPPETRA